MINFNDLKKVDLRVAEVRKVEKVEDSKNLLKIMVSLGDEERQIIAGLAQTHGKEDLEGEQIVIVANLEPKTIFGMESQGMLLAAEENGDPVIIRPEKRTSPGAKIH